MKLRNLLVSTLCSISVISCSMEKAPSPNIGLRKGALPVKGVSGDVIGKKGSSLEGGATVPGAETFLTNITYNSVLKDIENDALKLNPSDQSKTRYFTLHVASNAGKGSATLDFQRAAFKKAINSLSTKAALVKPVAIDSDRVVYRVNLDDINISPEVFDSIINDFYPFGATLQDIGTADSTANLQIDRNLKELLKTDNYVIRMDWFSATAPLPVLYSKFLQYAENLSDFEETILGSRVSVSSLQATSAEAVKKLSPALIIKEGGVSKVDRRIANIIQDQVVRTGFDNSNVSFSNRIVERHPTAEGYWISYDFFNLKAGDVITDANGRQKPAAQADLDNHNINKTPLGPVGTNAGSIEFSHDGGEVIYSLPNGLFGYYLINAKGTLLDKGPLNVVHQNSGPPEFAQAITNGLSCMSCHNAGLLKQGDTITQGIGQNKVDINSADFSRINRIYNPTSLNSIMDKENARYFAALKEIGVDSTNADPVDQAFRFYNRPLTKKDVEAELDISDRDFELLLVDPEFSGTFNALNSETGSLNRGVFQAIYPTVVAKFKQDLKLVKPKANDFVVTADCMALDVFQMDECVINPLGLNLSAFVK